MLKFVRFILVLMFLSIYPLYGDCNATLEGRVMNVGTGEGIDSIKILNDQAYVSLNFQNNNLDGGSLVGVGRINISDPGSFISYDYNKYDYNATKYILDVSNVVKVYEYGKDFTFSNDDLGNYPHFELTKAVQDDDKVLLYGYTNAQSAVYIWKITLVNDSVDSVTYKKYDNFLISSKTSDGVGDYFLLLPNSDNTEGKYYILFASYGDGYTSSIKTVKNDDLTISLNTYPLPSITSNDNFIFAYVNAKVFKIDKSTYQAEDISDNFIDNQVGMFLYATCSYIFYSSDFDKLIIQNLNTNEYSSIKVWDPSKATLVNDTLLLANMGAMVNIINVSDPSSPYIESNTTEWGHTDEVVYKDNKMYVGFGWGGIAVYDISGCVADTNGAISQCSDSDDSDTDETTDDNATASDCCFTSEDLEALPVGWSLVGTGCDINDTSIFNSVKMVWKYNSQTNRWEGYSPDDQILNIIKDRDDIEQLNSIGSKKGFWILK